FSSRRRHTSFSRDWSSDVCSSDLRTSAEPRLFFIHVMKTGGTTFRRHMEEQLGADRVYPNAEDASDRFAAYTSVQRLQDVPAERSEERRVGKERRARWASDRGTRR